MGQQYTSAKTSLNQVPAGHKLILKNEGYGTTNLDIGGGAYNAYTKALKDMDVINFVYDPYNIDSSLTKSFVMNHKFDTVTCHNVLNVIQERSVRREVIQLAYDSVQRTGHAYFTVYEGDRSGNGRTSQSDCWQEHRKTKDYMEEIKKVFPSVKRKGKLIVAWHGEEQLELL